MSLTQAQIAQAIKNEDWQKCRLKMKGKATKAKLRDLYDFIEGVHDESVDCGEVTARVVVLNYLNALSRGGLIEPLPHQNYTLDDLFTELRLGAAEISSVIKIRR